MVVKSIDQRLIDEGFMVLFLDADHRGV